MEKFRSLVILISIFLYGSNSFAQDFVLKCSKFYSGSKTTVDFSILISKDRATGFFVYNDEYAYRLNLIGKSETDYDFKTLPFVSSNGDFLGYKSIKINRQTLDLFTTDSYGTENIKCQNSNFNVINLIENIKNQDLADKRKKASEESARKATINRDAKF